MSNANPYTALVYFRLLHRPDGIEPKQWYPLWWYFPAIAWFTTGYSDTLDPWRCLANMKTNMAVLVVVQSKRAVPLTICFPLTPREDDYSITTTTTTVCIKGAPYTLCPL